MHSMILATNSIGLPSLVASHSFLHLHFVLCWFDWRINFLLLLLLLSTVHFLRPFISWTLTHPYSNSKSLSLTISLPFKFTLFNASSCIHYFYYCHYPFIYLQISLSLSIYLIPNISVPTRGTLSNACFLLRIHSIFLLHKLFDEDIINRQ